MIPGPAPPGHTVPPPPDWSRADWREQLDAWLAELRRRCADGDWGRWYMATYCPHPPAAADGPNAYDAARDPLLCERIGAVLLDASSDLPEAPWPVRRVLTAGRRRYHGARLVSRPSLRDPRSCVGLFPARDLATLAKCGYWPLPARVLAWFAFPPAERSRRQRHWERRVEAVARRLLAAELPEAVAYLLTQREASQDGTPA